MQLEEPYLKK